jgi:hypothetical protein
MPRMGLKQLQKPRNVYRLLKHQHHREPPSLEPAGANMVTVQNDASHKSLNVRSGSPGSRVFIAHLSSRRLTVTRERVFKEAMQRPT